MLALVIWTLIKQTRHVNFDLHWSSDICQYVLQVTINKLEATRRYNDVTYTVPQPKLCISSIPIQTCLRFSLKAFWNFYYSSFTKTDSHVWLQKQDIYWRNCSIKIERIRGRWDEAITNVSTLSGNVFAFLIYHISLKQLQLVYWWKIKKRLILLASYFGSLPLQDDDSVWSS